MYRLMSGDPEALEEQGRDDERIRLKEQERANKLEQEKEEIGNSHERLGNMKGRTCLHPEKHLDSLYFRKVKKQNILRKILNG